MKASQILPPGKLPVGLLSQLLARAVIEDDRVLIGPAIGIDCAVIENGEKLLVLTSDPITFASDEIGWYAVQVSANDIATSGATPRWFLSTLLLPENKTTPELALGISDQVNRACRQLGISVIGGHTEITLGLERPILVGTLVGEVERQRLVTPRGAQPGDQILLTKGVPIEAVAILAREFPDRLRRQLGGDVLRQAAGYLYQPGISVVRDARTAVNAGGITAMHDPTEGGLAAGLWEMAQASGKRFAVNLKPEIVPSLAGRICGEFGIDPLAAIASGALLLTVRPNHSQGVLQALQTEGIDCWQIGRVESGETGVWDGEHPLPRPARDEITKAFEEAG